MRQVILQPRPLLVRVRAPLVRTPVRTAPGTPRARRRLEVRLGSAPHSASCCGTVRGTLTFAGGIESRLCSVKPLSTASEWSARPELHLPAFPTAFQGTPKRLLTCARLAVPVREPPVLPSLGCRGKP